MYGSTRALEALLKPALVLVTVVGLLAWGGAAGAGERVVPDPGQASLYETERGPTSIGSPAAVSTSGTVVDAGERRQPRTTDPRAGVVSGRRGTSGTIRPSFHAGPRADLAATLARARAGREAAPSTGPPIFPN